MDEPDWGREFRALRELVGRAREAIQRQDLLRADDELRVIERHVEQALARYQAEPVTKLAKGLPLEREEFHIVMAAGLFDQGFTKALGLSPVDDYEAFSFLHYETDTGQGYINPLTEQDPPFPTTVERFGRPPEEIDILHLSPEQAEFFRRYVPDIFTRFRRE
jgi:hypothetical protein